MGKRQIDTKTLRELTGVSRQAVSQAVQDGRLYKDPQTGLFDPAHSVNKMFIQRNRVENGVDDPPPEGEDTGELSDLYEQKIRAEIRRIDEQTRKLQLDNAKTNRDILPFSFFEKGLGFFAQSMRSNVLTIGKRVARGDSELQRRIEKETARAIDRSVETAQREVVSMVDEAITLKQQAAGGDS